MMAADLNSTAHILSLHPSHLSADLLQLTFPEPKPVKLLRFSLLKRCTFATRFLPILPIVISYNLGSATLPRHHQDFVLQPPA